MPEPFNICARKESIVRIYIALTPVFFILSLFSGQAFANENLKENVAIQKYVTVLSGDEFAKTGKIEQYFSLNCPVCYMVEPYVTQIKQDAKGQIPIEQLHVGASNKSWMLSQRVFATLSVMSLESEYKSQLFDHIQSIRGFSDDQQIFNWSKSYDWHKQFEVTYYSEQVDDYVTKVSEQIKKYRLKQVPTFIVNGKYKVLWGNDITKEEFSKSLLKLYKQSIDEELHQH